MTIRNFLVLVTLSIGVSNVSAQSFDKVVDDFVVMNNDGSKEEIVSFVKKYYHPDILKRINMEKHVEFYEHIQADFPKLSPIVHEVIEETEFKLIVHLKRENLEIVQTQVDPADILVVEIDLSKKNPRYLERGLGLGALICSMRKTDG